KRSSSRDGRGRRGRRGRRWGHWCQSFRSHRDRTNYEQANANTARLATRFPGRLRSTLTAIAEQFGTVTCPTVIDRLLQ
ncbi:hypothetical protein, partial [Allocoleopsis sp.]|uniref:hypothetical protein n=1 Tax=Allocoleopsis sp. TaxID=3088169 RepID=UPI002FD70B59